MNYARAIRTCRVARGLPQKELAARANVSPSHLSLLESGGRAPSTKVIERLSDALEIPLHLLLLLAAETGELRRVPSAELESLSRSLLEFLVSPFAESSSE